MTDGSSVSATELEMECRIAEAETKIAELAEDYEVWADEDLNSAKQALESARATQTNRKLLIQNIFNTVHNMKGLGGTFGYDLITLIGQSLCDFIRHIPDATNSELEVIHHHLAAMGVVLDKQIKGPAGPFADKITAKLEHLITECRGETV